VDGVIEPVMVHFEDLDAMGVVHNGRYVLLLERALAAYWTRAGWPFDPAAPRFTDVFFVVKEFAITYHVPITRVGPVHVQLWLDHLGNTRRRTKCRTRSCGFLVTACARAAARGIERTTCGSCWPSRAAGCAAR